MDAGGTYEQKDFDAFYNAGSTRFSSLPALTQGVGVIGLGSVGSHVAYALCKSGLSVFGFDPDFVAPVNAGVQMYGPGMVGLTKADALSAVLELLAPTVGSNRYSEMMCRTIDAEIAGGRRSLEYADMAGWVVCVDTMAARTTILDALLERRRLRWRAGIRGYDTPEFLFDTRVGMTLGQIYACNLASAASVERYRESLYDDEHAAVDPCNARAHVGASMIAAGMVAEMVQAVADRRPVPEFSAVDCKAWMTLGLEGTGAGQVGGWAQPTTSRHSAAAVAAEAMADQYADEHDDERGAPSERATF